MNCDRTRLQGCLCCFSLSSSSYRANQSEQECEAPLNSADGSQPSCGLAWPRLAHSSEHLKDPRCQGVRGPAACVAGLLRHDVRCTSQNASVASNSTYTKRTRERCQQWSRTQGRLLFGVSVPHSLHFASAEIEASQGHGGAATNAISEATAHFCSEPWRS